MNFMMYTAPWISLALHVTWSRLKSIKTSHFLGQRNDKVLYYDCSNYYFEIEQEDGSKKYGKSKEHMQTRLFRWGFLWTGRDPLAFSLFPGNAMKQTSLKPLEKKVLGDFGCHKFILLQ